MTLNDAVLGTLYRCNTALERGNRRLHGWNMIMGIIAEMNCQGKDCLKAPFPYVQKKQGTFHCQKSGSDVSILAGPLSKAKSGRLWL